MKNDLTKLVFVLDKSGSMCDLVNDTIGGFNSLIAQQRQESGVCEVTTILFSRSASVLHDRVDLQSIAPLTSEEYRVGGNTALVDALGFTFTKVLSELQEASAECSPAKVLISIITDGEENSSVEYKIDSVKSLKAKLEADWGCEFVFLGANIDAIATASVYGIQASHAADFNANSRGMSLSFDALSAVASTLRSGGEFESSSLNVVRADVAEN